MTSIIPGHALEQITKRKHPHDNKINKNSNKYSHEQIKSLNVLL